MNESFCPYPVLGNKQFMTIGYASDIPSFSYLESFEEFPLQIEYIGGTFSSHSGSIRDPRCSWHPSTHGLIIRKNCRIATAHYLFGKGGIAAPNATIGIALRWISSKSNQRGVIPFGDITKADSATSFDVECAFEQGTLRGSLQLQTILYLKDAGSPTKLESFFAVQTGTILGVLDQEEFFVDGNGSVFPISVINAPGRALWSVYYNDASDPMQDKFESENVEIRLNKAHPHYDALKIESSMIESALFIEVLSSALMVIVESVKDSAGEDWDNILNGTGFETGSIAEAVYYFVTRLQWDVSSPSKMASSIKEFFEKSRREVRI